MKDKIPENKILKKVSIIVIPITLLYGIYVVLNGHISPGGGFSGGAILGVALIIFNLAFGNEVTDKVITFDLCTKVICSALMFYACAKCYSFVTGANHLHSVIPLGTPGNILSSGLILPLNICVGFIVCCTIYMFYSLFGDWGNKE